MKRQASIQDISWFLDLENIEKLDLNPPYQRRSVWTVKDRRFFLDTIFRNYPCPPIFIHKTIDASGLATYHVVDGKQRLETILKFAKNKLTIGKDFGDVRLDGKKFKELEAEHKKDFWNYNVAVDFIDLPDGVDINEVFDRVNRNSRNLERQELRHARFDGWFISESETEADDDQFWEDIKVTSKAKAKRMKNVQFVSELLLIIIEKNVCGFDQDHLDEQYALLDSLEENESFDEDEYNTEKKRVKKILAEMEAHNGCVTNHARTAFNLYSLFALVALEPSLPAAVELAVSYNSFMETVEVFRNAEEPEELVNDPQKPVAHWDVAYTYFLNTKGANTEEPQRKARLTALQTALTI